MKLIIIIILIFNIIGCSSKEEKVDNNIVNELRDKYNNKDIIGYLVIPNILNIEVLQSKDNKYYLEHNIYKEKDIVGSIYMDYRVNIDSNKVLIYGHSGNMDNLPFKVLNEYDSEEFFNKNNKIYYYSLNKVYTYEVFSTYIEYEDFDYMNINNFNNKSYLEHIMKLKNKSEYNKDIKLDNNSKIIILQTCSMDKKIKANNKYRLVIGKLIKVS